MPDYAGHSRVLDAAARAGGWICRNTQGASPQFGVTQAIDWYISDEAAENHLSGDSKQGAVLEVFYNMGGYVIGANLKQGLVGKVIATTGNIKDRKAKERLEIAKQFILDHPLKEGK